MSKPVDIVVQSTREILAIQMKTMNSLLEAKEFDILNSCLKSTFAILSNGDAIVDKDSSAPTMYLDRTRREKFAKFCTRVIDCKQSVWQARHYALKILAILVKQLSDQPDTRKTLKEVYVSLKKKLQPPKWSSTDPDEYLSTEYFDFDNNGSTEENIKLNGLSAYCLNQIKFKHILSPAEARQLIKETILPLAVFCLNMETNCLKSTFQVFEDDFHGFMEYGEKGSNNNMLRNSDSFYTYPLVIRLLVALTKHSTGSTDSSSRGYRKELDAMLDGALKTGKIKDEHIVALNVVAAEIQRDCSSETLQQLEKILVDLLIKSEGRHRVHIAYMAKRIFSRFFHRIGYDDKQEMFVKTMIEDVITKNDELLHEIALHSLPGLYGPKDWAKFITGRELVVFRKLLEINSGPGENISFLERFDYFKDPQVSIEFDELARIPISQNINKLDYLLRAKSRDIEQFEQVVRCSLYLANLLRLHRCRLQPSEEMKLIELFDLLLLTGKAVLLGQAPVYLLVLANSYQVYPRVWIMLILSLRSALDLRAQYLSGNINNPFTYTLLSHFLMIDSETFYAKFGSFDMLKLIYSKYSGYNETLIKEILLTWPESFERTKMSQREYGVMLDEFVELLIRGIAEDNVENSGQTNREQSIRPFGFFNLLSGLVVAFCRHRETLYRLIASSGYIKESGRDLWIKYNIFDWTKQISDHRVNSGAFSSERHPTVDLASVVVAYDGLKMINEEFHNCPEFKESPKALLKIIKSSCDKGLQQVPFDSLISKQYQKIKDSLPSATA